MAVLSETDITGFGSGGWKPVHDAFSGPMYAHPIRKITAIKSPETAVNDQTYFVPSEV